MTYKQLVDKLDDITRQIFRLQYEPVCVICGKRAEWYHPIYAEWGIQVGHYISRNYKALRWDFKNLAPQCPVCNSLHNDNEKPFKEYMERVHGKDIIEYYDSKKRKLLNKSDLSDIYNSLENSLQNINKL